MACTYNLYSLLGSGASTTGTWSGTGTASPGYSVGGTPPTSNTFNTASIPDGTYQFTYTVTSGSCVAIATVNVSTSTIPVTVTWTKWYYSNAPDSSTLVPIADLNVSHCVYSENLLNVGTTN